MNEILIEKVDLIKKNQRPYGIILVGSSAKKLENLEDCSGDIDIFVIKREGVFEREVTYIDGIEFDISYITLEEIGLAIESELSSVISILAKHKPLYVESKAQDILDELKLVYDRGPSLLRESELAYGRFKLTKSIECLGRRTEAEEFELIAYTCLKEILKFQFMIKGDWIPPDKKLISSIDDINIKRATSRFLEAKGREHRLESLSELLNLVLKPIGGRLHSWNKSEYPFDFN